MGFQSADRIRILCRRLCAERGGGRGSVPGQRRLQVVQHADGLWVSIYEQQGRSCSGASAWRVRPPGERFHLTGGICNHQTLLLSLGAWPTSTNKITVAHPDVLSWFGGPQWPMDVCHDVICMIDLIYISASSIHVLTDLLQFPNVN